MSTRLSFVFHATNITDSTSDMSAKPSPVSNDNYQSHEQKRHVRSTLNYWDDPGDGSKPAPIVIGGGRITNSRPHKPHFFTIQDVCGEEEKYTLDRHGFRYIHHTSLEKEFTSESQIQIHYYPECRELLRSVLGDVRVHIFNHKVRRGPTQWHHLGFSGKNLANRGPVTRTHVDQSYHGGELRLRHEMRNESDELVKRRYQIINIWRPIAPIFKDPIAVASSPSVPDSDLIAAEMTEDGFKGEQWVVRHNSNHEWYYKSGMTPGDVLLIKCFDSREDVARRALHSAFEVAEYEERESRQSIEVRCLVLYDG
ncbi:hypothetical protein BDV96DRAFT_591706 [Lophiotrema nucula]|uniref:Methyltransferase n=1 Tax=Lophiotrema nucula TaxID=690887 RepID=A0A6A5YIR6_9PLEO|nr:hypothetical protein BDV96DRAFT_591706 [Lophiotrema nucula]